MTEGSAASGAQYVLKWMQAAPHAVAVIEGGKSCTYADVARHLANVVKALEAGGVRAGLIVGIECGGRYLRVLLALACEVLGATHVSLSAPELDPAAEIVRRCDMFVAEHAGDGLSAIGPVVAVDRAFAAALEAPVSPGAVARLAAPLDPDGGVRISQTSGTTGAPKRMLKTRRIMNGAIDSYDLALRPVAGDYTYLCDYSPAIGGVYTDVLRALKFGNVIRFVSSFAEIVAACQAERCYAYILPKDAERLAAACRTSAVNLNMYYLDVTGAGVSPALVTALNEWVSPCVLNVYSSNETATIAAWEADNRYRIVPGVEVRIVDDDWRPLPSGETGRICVRSPFVVRGYLWDEALTAGHFKDGWFLMSDLGYLPSPGELVVVGRWDDMVNIGGEKIAPYPVEQALKAIPGVADAVLLGVENDVGVAIRCAVIEPEPGADQAALVKRVAAAMSQRGEALRLHFEARFPRTETGKIQRAVLRASVERAQRRVPA